jgi:C1A family cysteine protease
MISRRSAAQLILAAGALPLVGAAKHGSTSKETKAVALEPSVIGYSYYRFGWRPDLPSRAQIQSEASVLGGPPPPSVDLRPQMPEVYDQHQISSCVANSVAACIEFLLRQRQADFMPSRLFIYYLGRKIEKTISTDSGLSIADAINVVEQYGVPSEKDWQYDGRPPDDKNQFLHESRAVAPPPATIMNKALMHRATIAFPLPPPPNLQQLKACLAQGFPFLFGFTIYKSFFNNNDNPASPLSQIPMPPDADQPFGGHAVVAVGYKDDNAAPGGGHFICRNSWGLMDIADRPVQDNGHFYLPYQYTQEIQGAGPSLASDFYTIRSVS